MASAGGGGPVHRGGTKAPAARACPARRRAPGRIAGFRLAPGRSAPPPGGGVGARRSGGARRSWGGRSAARSRSRRDRTRTRQLPRDSRAAALPGDAAPGGLGRPRRPAVLGDGVPPGDPGLIGRRRGSGGEGVVGAAPGDTACDRQRRDDRRGAGRRPRLWPRRGPRTGPPRRGWGIDEAFPDGGGVGRRLAWPTASSRTVGTRPAASGPVTADDGLRVGADGAAVDAGGADGSGRASCPWAAPWRGRTPKTRASPRGLDGRGRGPLGGAPRSKVPVADRLLTLSVPMTGPKSPVARSPQSAVGHGLAAVGRDRAWVPGGRSLGRCGPGRWGPGRQGLGRQGLGRCQPGVDAGAQAGPDVGGRDRPRSPTPGPARRVRRRTARAPAGRSGTGR